MKLYEITEEMKAINALVEAGDMTEEMVADTLEAMNIQFEDKARAVLMVRQEMVGDIAKIQTEVLRLETLKKAVFNDAERLSDYLKNNMLRIGEDKLDLGLFKVTLRKPSKKLGYIDEEKVPAQYFIVVPASKKINKGMLISAVKAGDTDCVDLIDSERSLQVR